MPRLRFAAAMLVAGLLVGCRKDASESRPASRAPGLAVTQPVTLPNTELHVLHASKIEEDYEIFVGLPPSYSSGEFNYPVVYVTDGGGSFPIIVSNLAPLYLGQEMPEVIIVGIGNRAESVEHILGLRMRDLSPTIDEGYFQTRKHAVDPPAGGADAFLDFIESEVKPFINENYRTEKDDETLAGYSLGGVFGFHVLFNHTDAFDKYIIGSPSLWWDDEICFDFEATYAKNNKDLAKRVFISVGSLEPGGATNEQEMLRRLKSREYANLKVDHFVFPGETHVSGLGTAFNRGLKFVFNDKPPLENNMP